MHAEPLMAVQMGHLKLHAQMGLNVLHFALAKFSNASVVVVMVCMQLHS
jgi:hypothetical protein